MPVLTFVCRRPAVPAAQRGTRLRLPPALVALVTLALPVAGSAARGQVLYTVTGLGVPSGYSFSEGFAVNNSGQVAVTATDSVGNPHAFRWSAGAYVDLGTLGGANYSRALAINAGGQVAGDAITSSGAIHAYRSDVGGQPLQDLGVAAGTNGSVGYGISTSGQVAGSDTLGGMEGKAFRTDTAGNQQTLSGLSLNDPAQALGSSPSGQVAGSVFNNGGNHAVRWNSGSSTPTDLGDIPGGSGNLSALAINDAGQATGFGTAGNQHAFRYSNGTMTDLGVPSGFSSSVGKAINASGQVVGNLVGNTAQHPFLYDSGGMRDLNNLIDPASGWVLTRADGISDLGQIVGIGIFNGTTQAFLLSPVPEPGSFALVGAGVAAGILGRRVRRRSRLTPV